jgi:DNA-directed RNA polymerase subunit RPC12/RpoP
MAEQRKAKFSVKTVEVQVACPYCNAAAYSPSRGDSLLWNMDDLNRAFTRQEFKCLHCGNKFSLPARLFNMLAGL